MIAFIRGNFVYKSPAVVHVEANGVGYELQISLNTYTNIQTMNQGLLYTWLHIREDAHVLYGFFDLVEKELFLQLISVSGIGASTARMMMSSLKPEEIAQAIAQSNTKVLEGIKGIGKKSAERVVLELKDKMQKYQWDTQHSVVKADPLEMDALNALVALGIPKTNAENAVKKVMKTQPNLNIVEEIIKLALKSL
ncbi:Holliday junction branch migration protein RuvA [Gynurincola endophyticus]|jgi:Holliday junction DNA helicase RuvA|uniref:Holliday junction branch migration protein RuvA n=1 Tax=Gynurincola endophyticus TaxID=2479004 RepID=UPI000F8D542C|nr:Holliday junction branch migration protein RuvA [Gynurincola endophyticus]